jgi:hypothetical protein
MLSHYLSKIRLKSLFLFITLFFYLNPIPESLLAQDRLNLPQLDTSVTISGKNFTLLRDYFSILPDTTEILAFEIVAVLLKIFPLDYRQACAEMITHWGTVAEGTMQNMIRLIFSQHKPDAEITQALLVFRCFSNYDYYLNNFYDERLALLQLHTQSATLRLLPIADNCLRCTDLYRIHFAEVVQKEGPLIISLKIESSSENPCCDGPYWYKEEQVQLFSISVGKVRNSVRLLKHKEENFHDDVEGDLTIIYNGYFDYLKNPQGQLHSIITQFNITENELLVEMGSDTLYWNKEQMLFKRDIKE